MWRCAFGYDSTTGFETHASQTKMFDDRTKGWACLFEALFEGVSTRFGRRPLAKCLEKTRSTHCFVFQNLRLGGMQLRNCCSLLGDGSGTDTSDRRFRFPKSSFGMHTLSGRPQSSLGCQPCSDQKIARPRKRVVFGYSHWAKIAQPLLNHFLLQSNTK